MASRRLANAGSELSLGRFGLNLMVLVRGLLTAPALSVLVLAVQSLVLLPLLVRMWKWQLV